MTKQAYKRFRFSADTLELIYKIEQLMRDYGRQGYKLTVRQLYYQLVTKNYIANNLKSYKRVASILNDARLAGLIDWEMIEDRTRAFESRPRWTSPNDIMEAIAQQYHQDLWARQEHRVYVVIEKEALYGVFDRVCRQLDVPLLCARGYPSVSVIRDFAQYEMLTNHDNGQETVILHFGDHDPSGLDMTRDLEERLTLFTKDHTGSEVQIQRIALNMDQIQKYKPPPNPAKKTDARFKNYRRQFGNDSWELDALTPTALAGMVELEVAKYIDEDALEVTKQEIQFHRESLHTLSQNHEFPTFKE